MWAVAHTFTDEWHAKCEHGANEPQQYRIEEPQHRRFVRLALLLCVCAWLGVSVQIRVGTKAGQDAINGANEGTYEVAEGIAERRDN